MFIVKVNGNEGGDRGRNGSYSTDQGQTWTEFISGVPHVGNFPTIGLIILYI